MYRGEPNIDRTTFTTADENAASGAPAQGLGELLTATTEFIRRRFLPIGLCVVFGIGVGLAYLKLAPPVYKATARILLENPRMNFVHDQSFISEGSVDYAQMENQIEILQSKPVALAVIKKLNLASSPDFINGGGPTLLAALERLLSFDYSEEASPPKNGDGPGLLTSVKRLLSFNYSQESSPPKKGGEPSLLASVKRLLSFNYSQEVPSPKSAKPHSDELVAALQAGLTCTRVGGSNVIEITYRSSKPVRAAQIANAVVDAYLAKQIEAKSQASRLAIDWLQKRLSELGKQAVAAEQHVSQYGAKNNIVVVAGKSVQDQRVNELNTRLVAARARTAEALARLKRYESILHSDPTGQKSSNGDLDASMPDAMKSPIIIALRQRYLELARRAARWTVRYGAKHQAVIELRKKMSGLRTSIAEEMRRLEETARNDYAVAKQAEQATEAQLASAVSQSHDLNSSEAKLRELEMNARNYRSLYDSFLQQQTRTVQKESFPIANARIVSSASPPDSKSKPKSALILAFSTIAGGALGFALGFLIDLTDHGFRTSTQIESKLGIRFLSMVPIVKKVRSRAASRRRNDLAMRQRVFVRNGKPYWTITERPSSQYTESIRFMKMAIDHALNDAPCKVVGITSAIAGEGKSTIAAALGLVIAKGGKRAIVIDCDFRHPTLSGNLAPRAKKGFGDVIEGKCALDEVVWRNPDTKLAFLPLGNQSSLGFACDVLSDKCVHALIERLRKSYDYVIVDLPPLVPIVDVQATTHWIDGFILAIEWGRTRTDLVRQALHVAPKVCDALIGAVLNKTDMHTLGRYDSCHNYSYAYEHRKLDAA